jgi:hypothetical protein
MKRNRGPDRSSRRLRTPVAQMVPPRPVRKESAGALNRLTPSWRRRIFIAGALHRLGNRFRAAKIVFLPFAGRHQPHLLAA